MRRNYASFTTIIYNNDNNNINHDVIAGYCWEIYIVATIRAIAYMQLLLLVLIIIAANAGNAYFD